MKKRIASFALAFVMILTVVAAALPVFAAGSTSFTVTADKSEAKPGETINYTVTMDAVENLGGLVLELDIPEGLTFVEGSGKVAEGLQKTMNAAIAEFTEETKLLAVGASAYTGTEPVTLLTFQCTIDEDAVGVQLLTLKVEDSGNIIDTNENEIPFTLNNNAGVNAGGQPVYTIVEGANGSWQKGSENGLTFKADGELSKFSDVKVDGQKLAQESYTVVSGSTVVTLTPDYLNTLSVGEHELTIVYMDGECSTKFTVTAAHSGGDDDDDDDNDSHHDSGEPEAPKPTTAPAQSGSASSASQAATPNTGDESAIALWSVVALLSMGGAVLCRKASR